VADMRVVCRVCDKIRRPLSTLAGAAGFRSLLSRSLVLAKQESPALGGWEVGPDGSLQGCDGDTAESGGVLIAHLIGLMITFIGETLTHRLLPDAEVKFERNESK